MSELNRLEIRAMDEVRYLASAIALDKPSTTEFYEYLSRVRNLMREAYRLGYREGSVEPVKVLKNEIRTLLDDPDVVLYWP